MGFRPGQHALLPTAAQALSPIPRPAREINKAVAGEPPGRALSACCGQVAWAAVSQSPMILVITGRSPGCYHPFHCHQRGWRRVLWVGCLWRPYRKVSFQRTTSDTFSTSPPAPSQLPKCRVEERDALAPESRESSSDHLCKGRAWPHL